MALDLTGKLSEVFERIGVDIADIFSKLNTNTNKVAELNTKVTDYQKDLVSYRHAIDEISRRGLPYTNLDGAVLVSSVVDNKVFYRWQSLSTVPMDAVIAVDDYYPNVTIESIRNATYNVKTGELVYSGGTLPLGAADESGINTEIVGAYTTLKLSDDPSERALALIAQLPVDENGKPDASFNYNIIFSTTASPIEAYNNTNLQSIKLNLSSTTDGDILTYKAINQDAAGGVVSGVSTTYNHIQFNYRALYIDSENSSEVVQTSDDIQYVHFIVTKESGTYEINDISVMKLIKLLAQE